MAKKTLSLDTEVKTAIIYCRVSTTEQADSGLGLEAQQKKCLAFCELNNYEVAGVFVDAGISASTLNRPELEKALSSLKENTVLVIYKLDRLTRSVADLFPLSEKIERAGAKWASVQESFDTSTATGRLMLRMMLELSQWEREIIGERTSDALQQKRSRLERLGTTPLGYKTDADTKMVTVDAAEMVTVRRARELRQTGLSFKKIANVLTIEGHRTKRNGKWAAQTVYLLIKDRYVELIS